MNTKDESRYGWIASNLKGFESWQAEITHAEGLGYKLVEPEYYIPHWSVKMRAGETIPKLYVMRRDGPNELTTNFDCYAAQLGYPIYYKTTP